MKKFFSLLFLLGFGFYAQSQILTITDSQTGKAVESATIVSDSLKISAISNEKGEVDISAFKDSKKIVISHVAYKIAEYSYKELEMLRFKIALTPKLLSLKEVSVFATNWERKKIDAPIRITSINMKEASFQNPQTTADLLGTSGYVFIQKSQLGGGSPMLRGMATNRVLLVIDGVRMNTAIFRSGNLQNVISLDANALETAEVLFGPGSLMYGSDAIGGVMSFSTLKPQFSSSEDKQPKVTGNAMTRISTANSEKTGHINLNVGFKKVALLSSFTYADYGDLRSGSVGGDDYFYRKNYVISFGNRDYMVPNEDSTLQVGSKYSQVNFMQKILFQPTQYLEFDYGFHFSETSKYNRYDRLYVMREDGPYKEKLRWAEWYYGPQKWQMHRLGITFSKSNVLFDKLQLIGANQFFEESRYDREFMYRELRMQKENVLANSLNIDLEKKIYDKFSIYYGYEIVHNTVFSVANLTHIITKEVDSTVTRYPNGSTWMSNGAYLSAKYKIHKKLLLTGGVRYNHFLIQAKFDTTFFPFPFLEANLNSGTTIGSFGLVFNPINSWQIYSNASNGFRAPNIDDLGKVFESVPGYLVVPNPNLKPEKVYNIELGTIKSFGNFLTLDASAYYTWLKDAMVRKDFTLNGDTTIRFMGNKSRIQAIQNVTEIDVYGFQAGIEIFYKGFGIRSNYSYQKGQEQTPDSLVFYPLRHAAPAFGSTHFTYEFRNKFKADFYVIYNAKMDYEDLALTERTNASYARDEKGRPFVLAWTTYNFKMAYYPNPFVSIGAGIENITDLLYRPYASGINAPGRNIITSLRVKF
jgi:hemoglobin/transferrin/lactoferrin receptor protein